MRYIRTKYEILDTNKEKLDIYSDKSKVIRTFNFLVGDREVKKTYDVISYSDSIEELCDDFIVTATSHYSAYITQTHTLEEAIEYCENNHMPKTKIRGAIWTKKGLIYVAKMNKEGKLELL